MPLASRKTANHHSTLCALRLSFAPWREKAVHAKAQRGKPEAAKQRQEVGFVKPIFCAHALSQFVK
jgi:hypothetical protein